ncbi:hypothetical protein DSC45_11990 [Streptomyces sp. YIM 130001]|uniref:protein phosphatase 2C domain-containing protein n=1 Tax=Streptomyces sp. YIM 130001 TaxID=2259644 RepID=UPI000E647E8C|nr:protein phosphatase 2C domain-containing protein [Streptomyces sp. YIM 130001]RII17612.1 hypothetical protein DSC45_11990 [Streptomyces sp. YIM 130001]
MSQQGDRHTGTSDQGDDWWLQLYDGSAEDTGPAGTRDTIDDRYAAAADIAEAGHGGPAASPDRATRGRSVPEQPVPESSGTSTPSSQRQPWPPLGSAAPAESPAATGESAPDGVNEAAGPARAEPYEDGVPERPQDPRATGTPSPRTPKSPAAQGDSAPPRAPYAPRAPWASPDGDHHPTTFGPTAPAPEPAPAPASAAAPAPAPAADDSTGTPEPGTPSGRQDATPPPRFGPPSSAPAPERTALGPRSADDASAPFGPPLAETDPATPGSTAAATGDYAPPPAESAAAGTEAPPRRRHPLAAAPVDAPARDTASTERRGNDVPASRPPSDAATKDAVTSEIPQAPPGRPAVGHVGDRPPTYAPEPTALPATEPDALGDLVADTVLDGATYGPWTLRAASARGDSARYRGEPRRDSLLTARFGTDDGALILVAMATGARATAGAHRAAAEACRWIGRAVGRSHLRLAEDLRAARRADLKSGLHRLTDHSLGKLRAGAAELGLEPEEYAATSLRCLLLPADPECRTRVFFGVGGGGLFRLRDGDWQDIEPAVAEATGEPVVGFGGIIGDPPSETPEGDRLTMDLGITTPVTPYGTVAQERPREPFRFRASVARPGDALLLCTAGLAEPLRGEPALSGLLGERWAEGEPPGLTEFLADTQIRVKGYADDRTACAIWEA